MIMKKILLIGQAPPIKKQAIPYDSTMLYSWLDEVGVSVEQAQNIFEFEAMTDKVPELVNGNQKPPSKMEMQHYYNTVLIHKMLVADVIILMGKTPINFFGYDDFFLQIKSEKRTIFTMIHPSKRNITLFRKNREIIIHSFTEAIKLYGIIEL